MLKVYMEFVTLRVITFTIVVAGANSRVDAAIQFIKGWAVPDLLPFARGQVRQSAAGEVTFAVQELVYTDICIRGYR